MLWSFTSNAALFLFTDETFPFLPEKNWNSTCNENLECTTQYCKPKEFVCACPVGKMIIEDLGTCVDASGKI